MATPVGRQSTRNWLSAVLTSSVAQRLLTSIPVFLGVPALTLILMNAVSGGGMPGITVTPQLQPADIERLREAAGLNEPLLTQYFSWLGGAAHGDFGHSMIDGGSVLGHIGARLPNTAILMAVSLLIAILIAIPVGVVSARRRGSATDHVLTTTSVIGFSVPQFWLALLFILIFAVKFKEWGLPSLPAGGAYDPLDGDLTDRAQHLILPDAVLSSVYVATWSRFVRASMIEVLSQDFVRAARAKGMQERRVVYLHALRNALVPLVTLVALALPGIFSGALVVETIFGWPGVGQLVYQRALQFDVTLVMGATAFVALSVVAANLLADLLYRWLDRRVRI